MKKARRVQGVFGEKQWSRTWAGVEEEQHGVKIRKRLEGKQSQEEGTYT